MDVLGFFRAFRYAARGILEALRTQQSFQIQAAAAVVVAVVLLSLPFNVQARALIFFIAACVLAVELFNTAFERLADIVQPQADPRVRAVKDFSAGAVLLIAIGAVVAGLLLLGEILS